MSVILTRKLLFANELQDKRQVSIEIEAPQFYELRGDFFCVVSMIGFDENPVKIFGIDSYQAMELAIRYVENTLSAEKNRIRITWPNGETYYSAH